MHNNSIVIIITIATVITTDGNYSNFKVKEREMASCVVCIPACRGPRVTSTTIAITAIFLVNSNTKDDINH